MSVMWFCLILKMLITLHSNVKYNNSPISVFVTLKGSGLFTILLSK